VKAFARAVPLALLLAGSGCGRAVSVTRLVPAPYNLGPARRLVLVEASGEFLFQSDAAAMFMAEVARRGVFEVRDATHSWVSLSDLGAGAAARKAKEFRAAWPADVYAGLDVAELEAHERRVQETEKRDGQEVEVVRHYAVADCRLRVRILDAKDGRTLADYEVTSHRRSYKSAHSEAGQPVDAKRHALEAAVAEGVAAFTPSRVDEWLLLEDEAPLAKEGLALLDRKDVAGARLLWEKGLATHPKDARLRYNLGAVSEALNDPHAAREYYEDALALAPAEARYRRALETLDDRMRDAEALRTKP
jgi:tetratricopeptide (TPR) repeat protein